MKTFQFLAQFNQWVNERLYGVISGVTEEEYRRNTGVFFGSLFQTCNHLLVLDRLWTTRLTGESSEDIKSVKDVVCPDFSQLLHARRAMDTKVIETVTGLESQDLEREFTFVIRASGRTATMKGQHMLLAMFNHQTHHRGQMHCVLTQFGYEIPGLDVPGFVR
jgi:uncharacterized damage-inducible protein DinB